MAQDRACNSCRGALNEDSKFCPACGTNVETPSDVDCPSCGEKNAPDSKYCDKCGTSLEKPNGVECLSCGRFNWVGAQICRKCGKSLEPKPKEESNIWVCEECRSENSDFSRYCETCGLERVFPTNPPPESYDERWSRAFGSPGTDAGSSNSSGDADESEESTLGDVIGGLIVIAVVLAIAIGVIWGLVWGIGKMTGDETTSSQHSVPSQNQVVRKVAPAKIKAVAPIIFSDEQASGFLLTPDDFPKNWTANRAGMFLDAKNDFMTDGNVKRIKITLETHETEAAAQAAFSSKKLEAQRTIDGRGISGDKLEDVKKYPLFVWNASQQANRAGVEKWTVIGVYGNITVKVYHEGNMYAPKKNFAVDMAKKQIDRINGK